MSSSTSSKTRFAVLAVFAVLAALSVATWTVLKSESNGPKPGSGESSSSSGSNSGTAGTSEGNAPGGSLIESLPVDLSGDIWQWPTDADVWPARERPPVHIFGKDYQGKVEATLMFDMLKVGTTVLSPISGRVVDVRQQPDSCDVELYIGDDSAPPISLDHILTTLQRGDVVTAGQAVGTVPKWQCNESFGGFELMVIGESGGETLALCPADSFSPELMAAWGPALAKVMNDWNTHAAGRSYVTYTPDEITNGVCASPTTPA